MRINKFISKRLKRPGATPGTLVHTGKKHDEAVTIELIRYNETEVEFIQIEQIKDLLSHEAPDAVKWININGLHDVEIIEEFGRRYNLHPLLLEDVVDTHQRPKFEDYEGHIFIVLNMLMYNQATNLVEKEQVSLVLGDNYLLSFQERKGDLFEPIRERIKNNKGRIRKKKADYLMYALIDTVVDNYFVILERMGEKVEKIEENLIDEVDNNTLQTIQHSKREMLLLRKSIWPFREVLSNLMRADTAFIEDEIELYLRDVYDHTIQVMDTTESLRDMVSGMLDIYLSSLSNKMNEVMKVLTIFAAIFIPLTFIAGVYGMNFQYMPELGWRWGYFGTLGLMLVVGVAMLIFFKKKGWL